MNKVIKEMNNLGTFKHADDIAAHFASLGVQGTRIQAASCPVANYIKKTTRRWCCADPFNYSYPSWGRLLHSPIPRVVGEFIIRFDAGLYPYLESSYVDE